MMCLVFLNLYWHSLFVFGLCTLLIFKFMGKSLNNLFEKTSYNFLVLHFLTPVYNYSNLHSIPQALHHS